MTQNSCPTFLTPVWSVFPLMFLTQDSLSIIYEWVGVF